MNKEIIINQLKAQNIEGRDGWIPTSSDSDDYWKFVRISVDEMNKSIQVFDDKVVMKIPNAFECETKTFNFNDFYIYLNKDKLEESRIKYKLFMQKYKDNHACCPKCGETPHTSTLAGFIFLDEDPESYQDKNDCVCSNCGDRHIYHDRVPIKK